MTFPDGFPLACVVHFEAEMKRDAISSSRVPLRFYKMEQEALDSCVTENLDMGQVKVSNSIWVSNIVGIPKRIILLDKIQPGVSGFDPKGR